MILISARNVSPCARPYLCSVPSSTHTNTCMHTKIQSFFTVLTNEKGQCFLFQQGLVFFLEVHSFTHSLSSQFSVYSHLTSQPTKTMTLLHTQSSVFFLHSNQKWLTSFLCLVFSYGFLISLIKPLPLSLHPPPSVVCVYVCICMHDIVSMWRSEGNLACQSLPQACILIQIGSLLLIATSWQLTSRVSPVSILAFTWALGI